MNIPEPSVTIELTVISDYPIEVPDSMGTFIDENVTPNMTAADVRWLLEHRYGSCLLVDAIVEWWAAYTPAD